MARALSTKGQAKSKGNLLSFEQIFAFGDLIPIIEEESKVQRRKLKAGAEDHFDCQILKIFH